MNRALQRFKYIMFDILSAALSYFLFYVFRKKYIESDTFGYDVPIEIGREFILGIILIPLFWLVLHFLSGYYRQPLRKSRLQELGQTIFTTLFGVLILFFLMMLDDWVGNYRHYYVIFLAYFGIQFVTTYVPRLFITSVTSRRIHNRKLGFNTIMVGSDTNALSLYNEIENIEPSTGFKFIGFINTRENNNFLLKEYLPHLGDIKDIRQIVNENKVEQVVIALETSENTTIKDI
ncbi:MAG: sugar transferase, partial [Bacteroidales bacterium]|nr:sugar transferase [Bacteroidales bacterium]